MFLKIVDSGLEQFKRKEVENECNRN